MSVPELSFHHFGLAVRQPQEAIRFLSLLGYEMGKTVYDPLQNVHLQLCTHPTHPAVEIISPGEGKGPLDTLVQRHASGIVYHTCYVTPHLEETLAGMEQAGLRLVCVAPPKPAVLFGGLPVSFYNVVGMGLIEIIEGKIA